MLFVKGKKMVVVFKKIIIAIALICLMTVQVQAAGPTVSFMTQQLTSVNNDNVLGIEVGYFLGVDSGLEPYIGLDWYPRWDEDGDMEPPSVVKIGVRNWFSDLIDPESAIPLIPDFLLAVLNEDVEIRPYVAFDFSANFIDKDAGKMSFPAGIAVKTSPESNTALRFEVRWSDTFGDLNVVPDNRFDFYMGVFVPF